MQIGGGRWSMMPPVVKNLLITNGLMYLATVTFQASMGINLYDYLGLHYFQSELFSPFQFVSYMFMHGDISHLFFNMFAVWMFGNAIENAWGSKRFLIYYILTGFGAAFLHYLTIYMDIAPVIDELGRIASDPTANSITEFVASINANELPNPSQMRGLGTELQHFNTEVLPALAQDPNNSTLLGEAGSFVELYKQKFMNMPNVVGASGSLFGILLAFGMMFPNVRLFFIFLPIPIKAKYFVIGYGVMEFVSAFQASDNVAHFAHLGGMLFGFIILKIWERSGVRWR